MDKENVKRKAMKHGKSGMSAFRKKTSSLLKKADEFKILCGVQLCCIIYGPKLNDRPSRPQTWASEKDQLLSIIDRYKEIVGGGHTRAQRASSSSSSALHENSAGNGEVANLKFFAWDLCFDDLSEVQLSLILGKVMTKLSAVKNKLAKMAKDEKNDEQQYLKDHKMQVHTNKNFPLFNYNGSQFDSMRAFQYAPLHVRPSSHSDQRHWMAENTVAINPQMLNHDKSDISKSPQKE